MMKPLFYIISLFPKSLFIFLVDTYLFINFFRLFKSYKVTKANLKIAYPELNLSSINLLSKLSIRESIISGYETIYTWGRRDIESNSQIFRIENKFLLNNLINKRRGLIAVAIHNRSVDMLLRWLNSNVTTVSLYKKIKIKFLDTFVKKERERGGSKSVETGISGVRKILNALSSNNVICFAADQVPQRGHGEYIKFYKRDAYTTTLVQTLAVKTKAPVLYFYLNSNKGGFLTLSLKACNNDIYDDSKHKLLLNSDIEKMINKRPIDYSWEYKRFKKNKAGQSNPYSSI